MHLAIKSSEAVNSSRSVRYLLVKKSPIDIPDNLGKLPVDSVNAIKSLDLQVEIRDMLVSLNNFQFYRLAEMALSV